MPRGLGLILYGTEGIGKTGLSLQFPKPLHCLSVHEPGFIDLEDNGEVPKGCNNVIIESLSQLKKELNHNTEAKTIVIDSISGLQEVIFKYITDTIYDGDVEAFIDYYKGPRQHCPPIAAELCGLFENLRNVGKNVIVIGHDSTEIVKNPRGIDYNTVEIEADKGIRDVFKKWAQCIFFMTLDPNVSRITKMDKGKNPVEGKMQDEDLRVMFTEKSLVHSAKNKLSLPPLIPLGGSAKEAYSNFVGKLPGNFQEALIG